MRMRAGSIPAALRMRIGADGDLPSAASCTAANAAGGRSNEGPRAEARRCVGALLSHGKHGGEGGSELGELARHLVAGSPL